MPIHPGGDDERVLLQILSSLDKAYSAKYEKQLEEARADLLSSSYSFQVVADEVRAAQASAQKKWEKEVRGLKEQMSTNQKRLFLLEREKEGLMKSCAASEEASAKLRTSVSGLTRENATLRERQVELESQLATLRETVAAAADGGTAAAAAAAAAATTATRSVRMSQEVSCQTVEDAVDAESAARLAMERWQQQMSAMSDWLATGAALLQGGGGSGGGAASVLAPPLDPSAVKAEPVAAESETAVATAAVGHGDFVEAQADGAEGTEGEGASASEEPSSMC